jgi:Ni/Co efflux regulator RcnB
MSTKLASYLFASIACISAAAAHADGREHRPHDRGAQREYRHHDGERNRAQPQHRRDDHRGERRAWADHDRGNWNSHRPDRTYRPRDERRYAHVPQYRDHRRYVVRDYPRHHYDPPRVYRHYDRPRYRVAYYERPYGYRTYHWTRGARLPMAYCAPRYIVHDYYSYGLRRPPYGYHWIRVDTDVVLAAVTTGIVLDVVDQIFW